MSKLVYLSEACDFLDNMRKPITKQDRINGPYPYYGASGVQDYVNDYIFDEELVLLAEDGGHFDDPSRGVAYRVSGKCWVNNHAHVLKPKNNTDVNYLGYVLKYFDVRPFITGAVIKKLNQKDARRIKIPLPSIEEQRRIVDLLDQADTLRQKRKQAIDLLDEYLKSVFLDKFGVTSKDYFSWEEVEIQELVASHKGSMRTGPFGSDLKHSEFVDQGVAVIGIDNAVNNKFTWKEKRFITHEKYEKLKRYTVYPRDVIVTIMATIGRSSVIPENIPLAINTKHLATITFDNSKANPYFISYSIHSDPQLKKQIQQKNIGAIMPGLNLGIIKKLKIRTPPIALQNSFEEIYHNTQLIKQKMLNQSEELEYQFQALMQLYFKKQESL